MRKWALAAVAAPLLLLASVPLLVVAQSSQNQQGCGVAVAPAQPAGGFTGEQISIARAAVQVADQRKLPARAKLVILATGFQESGIRNLAYGDRDSVGWLQQRPSSGWGTVAQIMDPAYGAGKFYDALVRVPGWQGMPVTVAAQAVQISAFPDAYAKWEASARALLAVLGDTSAADCATDAAGNPKGGGPVPAAFNRQGNPRTVEQAIAWMRRNMPNGASGEPVQNACERYMNLSYGIGGGYPTALAHLQAPGPRTAGMSTPPRGALVFWRSGNPAGHVALSLGNGQIISTDYDSKTGRYTAHKLDAGPITDIDRWGPRLGWRAPNFRIGSESV